ncbi:glycoside hydrolase family 28 protein [Parasediminibacterium sp. JCM 36343]|uniref:glycoside hydrolase family 28 protein n=1 Tax=Parasediminibacterium sp. JCM 36343 TaxID=3374279 RepID=UPI00397BF5DC
MVKRILLGLSLVTLSTASVNAQYSWDKLPKAVEPYFKKDTFNIVSYGAKADGITLNTKSINDAIVACNKSGGGVVLIPAGYWLSGPVVLKSNVNLHLNSASILQFTTDFNQYPLIEGNWEGKKQARNQPPLSADNVVNVAITGKGIVDGNGDAWRMVNKDKLTENEWKKRIESGGVVSSNGKTWYPNENIKKASDEKLTGEMGAGKTLKDFEAIKDFLRPNLLVFTSCKKVLLEGLTFQNSPAWCLHPLLCVDLTIRNVYAKNPDYAQNGDGLDIESCKNVLVESSIFDVGDDGICIKSGKDEEGRKRGIPTENVVIRNNTVYKAHGGFVIGSEMSGGARNIFVYDCSFMGTDKGLRFKTARGRGGMVENIYCKDIFMKDIIQEAIYFDMYYFTKPPKPGEVVEAPAVTESTPQFQNFYIDNIICNGAEKGVFIRGLPEMSIKNINLNNLVLKTKKGIEIIEAQNINLNNIQSDADKANPVVYIENSNKVSFNGLVYNNNSEQLFSINGNRTKDIKTIKTNIANAKKKAEFNNGALENSLEIQ